MTSGYAVHDDVDEGEDEVTSSSIRSPVDLLIADDIKSLVLFCMSTSGTFLPMLEGGERTRALLWLVKCRFSHGTTTTTTTTTVLTIVRPSREGWSSDRVSRCNRFCVSTRANGEVSRCEVVWSGRIPNPREHFLASVSHRQTDKLVQWSSQRLLRERDGVHCEVID